MIENKQQVIDYLVNYTGCKDERNAKAAIGKAVKGIAHGDTIKIYKTRFMYQPDNKLWIYVADNNNHNF